MSLIHLQGDQTRPGLPVTSPVLKPWVSLLIQRLAVSQETVFISGLGVIVAIFILGSTQAALAWLTSTHLPLGEPFDGEELGPLEEPIDPLITSALLRLFSPFGQAPKRE